MTDQRRTASAAELQAEMVELQREVAELRSDIRDIVTAWKNANFLVAVIKWTAGIIAGGFAIYEVWTRLGPPK